MLYKITLLTSMMVAVLYPLCFWISVKDPLKNGFHHFHTGLPTVLAGILAGFIYLGEFPSEIKIWAFCWALALIVVSFYYWNRETPRVVVLTIPVIIGACLYITLHENLIGYSSLALFLAFISGFIFSTALYSMNLGHWYLNVHGLPLSHLFKSVYVFAWFLIIRLIYNCIQLPTATIVYQGERISLFEFTTTLDGFLLWLGIFFGLIFPIMSLYYVLGTLKVKSTQSATGILYVVLASILIGDITYKYYLIKFGIAL